MDIASFSLAGGSKDNSDAIAHTTVPGGFLLAIADGIGSARHGRSAARLAVEASVEIAGVRDISSLFAEISTRIKAAAQTDAGQWGTTLTVCIVRGGRHAIVGHVGDTRIYHIRGKGLQSRTRDQTEVERLIQEGVLTPQRALRYPRRNILLSALSDSGEFDLQQSRFELADGDRVLLLSDGVYRQVSKRDIAALSDGHSSVTAFVDALKALLRSRGLVDDASALCAQIQTNE